MQQFFHLFSKYFLLLAAIALVDYADAQTWYITSIAGNGNDAYYNDGGPADTTSLNFPNGVAVDSAGDVYIADWLNNRIRKVNAQTGIITTVAGNGNAGYTGDNGAATSATLDNPVGIALDDTGNIYIADEWNHVIREVRISTGKISTVAGNGHGNGTPYGGYFGDGGAATSAELNSPVAVAVDDSGNIYIADNLNDRIRKVSHSNQHISTIAGDGYGADTSGGYSGDGAKADSAELFFPTGVAVDDSFNVYIADAQNDRIRVVDQNTGIINTIAGTGYGAPGGGGYGGDGGAATLAKLYSPTGLAVDAMHNVYVTDRYNNRVRQVVASSQDIYTIAGDGTYGFGGDGGAADSAQLGQPAGIAVDDSGNVYIADVQNSRIRKIIPNNPPCTPIAAIPQLYDSVCTGDSGIFIAMVTNGGSKPVYQWKLNGVNAGADTGVYKYAPVHNGDKIYCIVTSNAGCAFPKTVYSDTLKMGIYSGHPRPFVGITADTDNVCSNVPITFSSLIYSGGTNPVYRWQVNGDSVGNDSSVTLANLHDGDTVICLLTSNLTCALPATVSSDTLVMTIDSAVSPALTIYADNANPCPGQPAHFGIASSNNGGDSTIYEWTINGIPQFTDTSFNINFPVNGDTVSALIISSLACVNYDSAFSNNIILNVTQPVAPVVTLSGDTLHSSAASGNQWYYDSAAIPGATGVLYVATQNGTYYAQATDSNHCTSGYSDSINYIAQAITDVAYREKTDVFPNPSDGIVTLVIPEAGNHSVAIFDGLGKQVYQSDVTTTASLQKTELDLSNLVDGVYILQLSSDRGLAIRQISIQK